MTNGMSRSRKRNRESLTAIDSNNLLYLSGEDELDTNTSLLKRIARETNSVNASNEQSNSVAQHTTTSMERNSNEKRRSEMGIIEEIYCENFMCHHKLRVALSPHINFITGENGSGKSAIIAAIQICLGGSARSTHRGKSIKRLIRNGHEGNALVRVTLRNDASGGDAFRPDVYGDKIVVERLIRRDGSAEYRLRSSNGTMVSKMKTELEAMLDHLNIQIENPCAILDQENAKLFLKGSPNDKYKFFLQSTDLYKMRATYSKIDEETSSITATVLKREQQKIQILEDAMKEAEARWEEAQSIGRLEEEFEQVKKALAWSFVLEKEAKIESRKRKLNRYQASLESVTNQLHETTKLVKSLDAKVMEKNAMMETTSQDIETIRRKKVNAKKAIHDARQPLHELRSDLKHIDNTISRSNERIARLKREIANKRSEHEQIQDKRSDIRESRLREIEAKKAELVKIEDELQTANNSRPRGSLSSSEIEEHENKYEICKRQLCDASDELNRLQQRLSNLQNQRSRGGLSIYGPKVPQLQQMINENRHRFTEPPIGPVGTHVKLPERFMHLALAIEIALKGTLNSYLVVNGRDKALMDDLKHKIGCPPSHAPIIIAKRTGRRYSNLRLAEGALANHALCNILEVDHNDVFNALIDVCSAESKLLFNDRETGENAVLSGTSGRYRMAKYVGEVYLPNADKFVVRQGNIAYIPHKGQSRSNVICQDVEGDIRELEGKIRFISGHREALSNDVAHHQKVLKTQERLNQQHQDQLTQLSRNFHKHKVTLRNLEADLAEAVASNQNLLDTTVYEEEIRELQEEKAKLNARKLERQRDLETINPDIEHLLTECENLSRDEEQLVDKLNALQEDANEVYKYVREQKTLQVRQEQEANGILSAVNSRQTEIQELNQECNHERAKVAGVYGNQEELSIELNESHDYYGKRLTFLKRQLDKERSRFEGMDLNELLIDKEEKYTKFKNKKAAFDQFQQNLSRVIAMLHERQKVWEILRKEIASRTCMEFNDYMMLNNFAGRLKFHHDNQKLDITVLHNDVGKSKASQVSDMKELSGGERSYTQVSLLLALGESIECPFRVMDEFDVFMDSVNRDMTIQLLVDAAKKDSTKQFIFVTPNDLSAVRKDKMVKIQKMDPPRDQMNIDR